MAVRSVFETERGVEARCFPTMSRRRQFEGVAIPFSCALFRGGYQRPADALTSAFFADNESHHPAQTSWSTQVRQGCHRDRGNYSAVPVNNEDLRQLRPVPQSELRFDRRRILFMAPHGQQSDQSRNVTTDSWPNQHGARA